MFVQFGSIEVDLENTESVTLWGMNCGMHGSHFCNKNERTLACQRPAYQRYCLLWLTGAAKRSSRGKVFFGGIRSAGCGRQQIAALKSFFSLHLDRT
jgi:hypothetical protein